MRARVYGQHSNFVRLCVLMSHTRKKRSVFTHYAKVLNERLERGALMSIQGFSYNESLPPRCI